VADEAVRGANEGEEPDSSGGLHGAKSGLLHIDQQRYLYRKMFQKTYFNPYLKHGQIL
jgi:hypothetical protein